MSTKRYLYLWGGRSLTIFLTVFSFLLGCGDEQSQTLNTMEKNSEIAQAGKERLKKADDLKKYGFDQQAQQFYQELAAVSYTDEVRKSAFDKWMGVLEEQEDPQIAVVGQRFAQEFPNESPAVHHRLLQFYVNTWEWSNAYDTAMKLEKSGTLQPKYAEKKTWLRDLQQRSAQWTEEFDKLEDGWSLTNPYATTSFYRLDPEKRELQALVTTPSWYHAAYRFHWTGDNTVFSFDIAIQESEIGAQVNFGFFREPTKIEGDYLKSSFSCTGNKQDTNYEIHLMGQSLGVKGKSVRRKGGEYRLGKWYRVKIDYVKTTEHQTSAEARMVVCERDTGKLIAEETLHFNVPLTFGGSFFGYAPSLTKNLGSLRFKGRSKADNLAIDTLPKYISRAEPGRLDQFYEANLAVAFGDPLREGQIYSREMGKEKCPWPFWEMRALSYLESDNIELCLEDLKELVRRCPTHPTKPYLDRQIALLEENRAK